MTNDNKILVLKHIDLSWNRGEFDRVQDILSENFHYKTTFTNEILDGEQYIQFIQKFREAIPDISVEVELIMSEDNHVMTQISFCGIVEKMIFGIPASDRVITFNAVSIWEINLKRISNLDTLIDMSGLERQVGTDVSPLTPLGSR